MAFYLLLSKYFRLRLISLWLRYFTEAIRNRKVSILFKLNFLLFFIEREQSQVSLLFCCHVQTINCLHYQQLNRTLNYDININSEWSRQKIDHCTFLITQQIIIQRCGLRMEFTWRRSSALNFPGCLQWRCFSTPTTLYGTFGVRVERSGKNELISGLSLGFL